jgi:hypothetical protein
MKTVTLLFSVSEQSDIIVMADLLCFYLDISDIPEQDLNKNR